MLKSYNREEDGTTYYYRDDVLMGHPTNKDGTCDFDPYTEIAVTDYAEPLTENEINEIKTQLA